MKSVQDKLVDYCGGDGCIAQEMLCTGFIDYTTSKTDLTDVELTLESYYADGKLRYKVNGNDGILDSEFTDFVVETTNVSDVNLLLIRDEHNMDDYSYLVLIDTKGGVI